MSNVGDEFNVAIVATARAEMAARGWSVDDLRARLPEGMLSRRTLFRLVDTEPPPDREAPVWRASYIAAVADAFGMTPYQFIIEVERRQSQMTGGDAAPTAPSGGDPRSLITWLIDNPDRDAELATRLGDVDTQVALSGRQKSALRDTVRAVRREELLSALDALPPSAEQGGSQVG